MKTSAYVQQLKVPTFLTFLLLLSAAVRASATDWSEWRGPARDGVSHEKGLPEKWSPIEAFVLVKCINDEGNASWVYRTTSDPNREELLGVLVVHTELLRREIVSEWEDEEPEDE